MKLTYLGTAAAEGWPAVYCNCDHCVRARKAGGKNIRTRSQALINDDMLIDYPGDTYMHELLRGFDLSAIRNIIVTHAHLDHFEPLDMHFRHPDYYCHNRTSDVVDIYGSKDVVAKYERMIRKTDYDEAAVDGTHMHLIEAYKPTELGNYTVTAMKANHAQPQDAYVYIVTDGKSTLLYLHDTGLLFDEVYAYLAENHIRADLVSYDCTYGALPSGGGHLGLDSCPVVREKLREIGVVDDKTINVINHFSHNGKLIYDELVPVAAADGFLVSYDGMQIEF